jgi:hypothetical protein
MLCSVKKEMNTRKSLTILGLLAAIGIVMGGIGSSLAQDIDSVEDLPCEGTGPLNVMNGRGFWSQLTEEQRIALYEEIQLMIEAGATHEEIQSMKATMLESWGIDAPLWSGPHIDGQGGSYRRMTRDGQGSRGQYGGRGTGCKGNNGVCQRTN